MTSQDIKHLENMANCLSKTHAFNWTGYTAEQLVGYGRLTPSQAAVDIRHKVASEMSLWSDLGGSTIKEKMERLAKLEELIKGILQ